MTNKDAIASYQGWVTDSAGERVPLEIVIDTGKRSGFFALSGAATELTTLKRAKAGTGLVGRAKQSAEAWGTEATAAGADFDLRIITGSSTAIYTQAGAMLFYWLRDIKLPKA